jgi:hypothetical protein
MADYLDREHKELHHGMLRNCVLGLGLKITQDKQKRLVIEVDPTPVALTKDTRALRDFMRATALSWLDQTEELDREDEAGLNDNILIAKI